MASYISTNLLMLALFPMQKIYQSLILKNYLTFINAHFYRLLVIIVLDHNTAFFNSNGTSEKISNTIQEYLIYDMVVYKDKNLI